ncbi:MAG: hypothetical protein ACLR6I_12465 [Waltera sp.]
MYGGTITGNRNGVDGISGTDVFNMYGGTITGNRVGADIPADDYNDGRRHGKDY